MVAKHVERLRFAQGMEAPTILQSMKCPKTYTKNSHWMWWVFPLTRMGRSDPDRTKIDSAADVKYLLIHNEELWVIMLRFLLQCRANGRSWDDIFNHNTADLERFYEFLGLMISWERHFKVDHPQFAQIVSELADSVSQAPQSPRRRKTR